MRPDLTPDKFVEWLKQQPKEFIREGNEREHLQAEKDYTKFVTLFKEGQCSICMKPLKSFSDKTPFYIGYYGPEILEKSISPSFIKNLLISECPHTSDGLLLLMGL